MKTKIISLLILLSSILLSCEDPIEIKPLDIQVIKTSTMYTLPTSRLDGKVNRDTFNIQAMTIEIAKEMYPNSNPNFCYTVKYDIDGILCSIRTKTDYEFKILTK